MRVLAILTIIMVVAKLTDHIDWSWWVVLAAVWIFPAIVLSLGSAILMCGIAIATIDWCRR